MADYQEYRRRILHRRWRRVFIIVALLALVALLSAIGILWKVLHRERVDTDRKSTRLNSSHRT